MSISDTVKKVMPYLKTASGYVLHRLSSQAVEMDDGTTLEQKVTSLNSLISNKVDTSNVVNNCLTTEAGFVLDARQGKVLDDKITELNGKLPKENGNYIKFADGTLIQWGRVNSPGNGPGTGTVIFPMAFADINYVLEATPEYGGSAYPVFEVSCQRTDASSAVCYFRQNGNTLAIMTGVYAFWLAIGKWK